MTEQHREQEDDPISSEFEDDSDTDNESKASSRWRRLMEGLSACVRLSVVAGVLFTGYQYWGSVDREKTQRSFELVDLWESDRIHDADVALSSKLQQLQVAASGMLQQGSSKDELIFLRKFVADKFLEEAQTDRDLAKSYGSIVYFLNRISNCASSGLCNPDVLDDFFKDYAVQFWSYFGEALSNDASGQVSPIGKYLSAKKTCFFGWCRRSFD